MRKERKGSTGTPATAAEKRISVLSGIGTAEKKKSPGVSAPSGTTAGEAGLAPVPHEPRHAHHKHAPKSKITDRTKVRVVPVRADREGSSGSDPGSDQGSDLAEWSGHRIRLSQTNAGLAERAGRGGALTDAPSALFSSDSDTSSSDSAPLSSDDSLLSSIHNFRDDFDSFKCKMRIFGESLNLCKCIAHDFKGKLMYMERRLYGLEKRQKRNKTHNNYTAIIQKNKQLSTKTKEYVQKLQKCGTEQEMREVAGRICRNYLPGLWKVAEPNDLHFRKITGGLSNFLYLVGLPEDEGALLRRLDADDEDTKALRESLDAQDVPRKVLIRIYGQVHGERAMDAIVSESVIFTLLSERRLGPRLYGVFSGGRIEEYIPARCLLTRELSEPSISMKIAEKTANIHSMEIPLSKEGNYLWKTMGKWLKTVAEDIFSNGIKGKNPVEQAAIARLRAVDFAAEIEWLRKFLAAFDSAVVFCHNDLQEGNILYLEETPPPPDEYDTYSSKQFDLRNVSMLQRKSTSGAAAELGAGRGGAEGAEREQTSEDVFPDSAQHAASHAAFLASLDDAGSDDSVHSHISDSGEPKLYLIDFEYCAYNYRAFDIANHFAEWVYDYTNPDHPYYTEHPDYWPGLEQKEIFIKEYLKHFGVLTSESAAGTGAGAEPDIDAVNKLLAEVDAFSLASHLFWTLWSIVNASKSQIPFGYWEYGLSRLETYLRLKQEVIKKDKLGLPLKRKIEEVDI